MFFCSRIHIAHSLPVSMIGVSNGMHIVSPKEASSCMVELFFDSTRDGDRGGREHHRAGVRGFVGAEHRGPDHLGLQLPLRPGPVHQRRGPRTPWKTRLLRGQVCNEERLSVLRAGRLRAPKGCGAGALQPGGPLGQPQLGAQRVHLGPQGDVAPHGLAEGGLYEA